MCKTFYLRGSKNNKISHSFTHKILYLKVDSNRWSQEKVKPSNECEKGWWKQTTCNSEVEKIVEERKIQYQCMKNSWLWKAVHEFNPNLHSQPNSLHLLSFLTWQSQLWIPQFTLPYNFIRIISSLSTPASAQFWWKCFMVKT